MRMINGTRLHRQRRREGFRNLYESLFDDPRPQIEKIVRWILKNKHTFVYTETHPDMPGMTGTCCDAEFTLKGHEILLRVFKDVEELFIYLRLDDVDMTTDLTAREYALMERALSDVTKL